MDRKTNSMEQNPCSAPNSCSACYRSQRFITIFSTAHKWALPWPSQIQSTSSQPFPTSTYRNRGFKIPYYGAPRAGVAQSVQCLTTDWTTGVQSLTEAEDFSSSLCIQTGSGAHPASCKMGTGGPFPRGKARSGCDDDHSQPSSAEVKNE
jgi:hypothetical protein